MHIYSTLNKLFQVGQEEKDTHENKNNKEKIKSQEQTENKLKNNENKVNNCYALFPKEGDSFLGMYNNEKKMFKLEGFDSLLENKLWVKKSNDFLKDFLTKKMVYLEILNNLSGDEDKLLVTVYLDKEKTKNLNHELLNQDFSKQEEIVSITTENKIKNNEHNENKLNNCYALFSKDGDSFLGMYNNEKRTFKLDGFDTFLENKLWIKKSNEFIKEKISKKIIYLEFTGKKESEKDIVIVYLDKEKTKNLNHELLNQDFSKNPEEIIKTNPEEIIKAPKIKSWNNDNLSLEEDFFDNILDEELESNNTLLNEVNSDGLKQKRFPR